MTPIVPNGCYLGVVCGYRRRPPLPCPSLCPACPASHTLRDYSVVTCCKLSRSHLLSCVQIVRPPSSPTPSSQKSGPVASIILEGAPVILLLMASSELPTCAVCCQVPPRPKDSGGFPELCESACMNPCVVSPLMKKRRTATDKCARRPPQIASLSPPAA